MVEPCKWGHVAGSNKRGRCRECVRLSTARYYQKNKERLNAKRRQWRWKHQSHQAATDRRYYLRNREHVIERVRRWRLANPERHRASCRKSRLKYKGVNFWVEAAKESL